MFKLNTQISDDNIISRYFFHYKAHAGLYNLLDYNGRYHLIKLPLVANKYINAPNFQLFLTQQHTLQALQTQIL